MFTDDYNRKTWVYFLHEKSEALNAFKHFKVVAENEIEKTIKVLRTDRGGEYNSKAFENFWAIHSIRQQLTATYGPQQNGVAERKNYLTPEEAWSGHKPAVGYFKVFGCIAYARILDQKRKKLDDKAEMLYLMKRRHGIRVMMFLNSSRRFQSILMTTWNNNNWNSSSHNNSEWVFDSVSGTKGSDDDPLNNTWELTELPQWHKIIGVKRVFKTKLNKKGESHKHKARLVAKGYKQEYNVDYTELLAPVARHDTI
ncbi:unnamed protein product [Prunus armeniaca]